MRTVVSGLRGPVVGRVRRCRRVGLLVGLALWGAAGWLTAAADPTYKNWELEGPGGGIQNGDLVEILTFWDAPDYEVTIDLREIDNTLTDPVNAEYVGDSVTVFEGETYYVWSSYKATHRVSESNTLPDADGIVVLTTAVDPGTGDSTIDDSITLCLSNQPPEHVQTVFIGDAERFVERDEELRYVVRNGDSLRIETTWRYTLSPLMIEADFSAVDRYYSQDEVFYWLADSALADAETYTIYYDLNRYAHEDGVVEELPIRITGRDGGCGQDEVTLLVEMDNAGPEDPPVFHALPDAMVGETLTVSGRAPADSRDVLIVLNYGTEIELDVVSLGDSLVFEGTLTLDSGTNHLVAYGRDLVGNRSPASEEHYIDVQGSPLYKGTRFVLPDTSGVTYTSTFGDTVVPVENGDLVRFYSYWDDRAAYDLWADFSEVDSEASATIMGVPCADLDTMIVVADTLETWLCYSFEYRISDLNTLRDAGPLVVPVTAYDPTTGRSMTSEAVLLCLSNSPPEHLWTRTIDSPLRYHEELGDTLVVVRNGGFVKILTSWRSPQEAGLWLTADLAYMDRSYEPQDVSYHLVDSLSQTDEGIRTYSIEYAFGRYAWDVDSERMPYPLPGVVKVKDQGCGSQTYVIWFEMDNDGPEEVPWFDPDPVSQTTASETTVRGAAPEGIADIMLVVRYPDAPNPDSLRIYSAELDENRLFEVDVALIAGRNTLELYGRDTVGNWSADHAEVEVLRVTEPDFTLPRPFYPGDEFALDTTTGWSRVQLEVFNLEGDRVRAWEWRDGSTLYRVRQAWDGTNHAGEQVRQGPYLFRVRTIDASGRPEREEVRAFVFQK